MRRVVLALSLGLAVLVAPAMAQETDTSGTANNLTQTDGTEVQETRTNPDIGTTAPNSGLSITGTVESWNDNEIVIRTTTGVEHIVLQPETQRPGSFTAGETVTIDYNRSSTNGIMIAEQIRRAGVTGTSTVDTESQLEQDVEEGVADLGEAADDAGAAISQLDDEVEEEIEEEIGSNLDNDATIGDSTTADMDDDTTDTLGTSLPATAGESPLVALLGVLALAGAAGLRRLF
jgi:hypothetical protein